MTHRLGSSARDVKLGDFGISRVLSTQTKLAETVLGTPYYLSPELVWGSPYAEASDVWALGVVAFQAAASRRHWSDNESGLHTTHTHTDTHTHAHTHTHTHTHARARARAHAHTHTRTRTSWSLPEF